MAKTLVTGATGFLGSHLMEELKGQDLIALGRSKKNLIDGIDYEFLDLRDFEKLDAIFQREQPEIVYHLAAKSAESTGEHSPMDMIESGYNTFFNTITAAIRTGNLKKFIYVSSAAVYGKVRTPYTEDQRPEPSDIYAVTKYANELALQILAKAYNFEYVIVRPHNITGERQDANDLTRNVVILFMQFLRSGKSPTIFGDGSSTRCYTYVKDVAKVLAQCPKLTNKILNVGSDTPTTIKELYDQITSVSGIHTLPVYKPSRDWEVDINTVNHDNARIYFNYKDTPFEEIIKKTWEWLRTQSLPTYKPVKKEIDL